MKTYFTISCVYSLQPIIIGWYGSKGATTCSYWKTFWLILSKLQFSNIEISLNFHHLQLYRFQNNSPLFNIYEVKNIMWKNGRNQFPWTLNYLLSITCLNALIHACMYLEPPFEILQLCCFASLTPDFSAALVSKIRWLRRPLTALHSPSSYISLGYGIMCMVIWLQQVDKEHEVFIRLLQFLDFLRISFMHISSELLANHFFKSLRISSLSLQTSQKIQI